MQRSSVEVYVRVRPCERPSESFRVEPGGKAVQIRQEIKDASNNTASVEYVTFACAQALENASQDRMFETAGRSVVDATLDGYNGTLLCYGQTGAGKSFTLVGSRENYNQRGIAARAIAHLFREVGNRPEFEFKIRFSCLEIYNDNMHDLLATLPTEGSPPRQELSLSENRGRVEVKGLTSAEVGNEQEALQLLFTADANRVVAQHQLNQLSSRSHVLYQIHIERRSRVANGALTACKLTLVDLAGSERLKKSGGSEGATFGGGSTKVLMKEAMSINKSLSFLEQVVVAVGSRKAHVPHRSSKLTAVLRESLGGNCKTVMVANVWPEERQLEETVSTLRFAMRMQAITNAAVVNSHAEVTPQQALAACQAQVHDLKRELAMHDQLAGRGHVSYEPYSESQKAELKRELLAYLLTDGAEPQATTLQQVRQTYALFKSLYAEQQSKVEEIASRPCPRCRGTHADGAFLGGGVHLSAEAEASPPVEVVEMVGDVADDAGGDGFGIGVAPPSSKPSNPAFLPPPPDATSADFDFDDTADATAPPPFTAAAASDAPEAFFAEFKRTAGVEVHSLLLENKRTLRDRKTASRRLATQVNAAKREIDTVATALYRKREQRGLGAAAGAAPEVIDDEEFRLVSELKAAKGRYRAAFDELTDERANVEHLSQAVENCRTQLLHDFSAFLRAEHPEAASSAEAIAAAAAGAEALPSSTQPSLAQPSGLSAFSGGESGFGDGGAFGSGFGGGGGAARARRLSADKPSTPYDQDEQFEEMQKQIVLGQDPDSLPFFKASKLASAKGVPKSRRPADQKRTGGFQ